MPPSWPAGLPGPAASATTRVGVVFACADAALLVTEEAGTFTAEQIPYPAATAGVPAATPLEHRPGSNELAGPAGDAGVWHLDVSAADLDPAAHTGPAVTASAVGDARRVLAVGVDGVLRTLEPCHRRSDCRGSAARAVQLRNLQSAAFGSTPPAPTSATPQAPAVQEIDYADGLRAARTFDVPAADLVLETGL